MKISDPIKGRLSGLLAVILVCACGTDSAPIGREDPGVRASAQEDTSVSPLIGHGQSFSGPQFYFDMMADKTVLSGETPLIGDETCCNKPGEISECWLEDAEADGVRCDDDADCLSGTCNTDYQVCTCTSQDQCNAGVCTSHNLCGPSWCNGYRICSCYGGCIPTTAEIEPDALCDGVNLNCCDGTYSIHPNLREDQASGTGFCSDDSACNLTDGWCWEDSDCPSDGNMCTMDLCDTITNTCYYENDPVVCDDGNTCTTDSCNPVAGCIHVNNTNSCDDGDACTDNDVCSGGACAGAPITCDDGNVCTDNSCDSAIGCVFTNNTLPCDDGDACTVDDICADGLCSGGPRDCSDGNDCTDDSCDSATGCLYAPNSDPCDDADACTSGDVCSGGVCVPGAAVVCDDGNICTDNTCDPAVGCQYINNTAACDDGNACTAPDVCLNGSCMPGADVVCIDGNDCTDDSCNPAVGCVYTNNINACDDLNICTEGDVCGGGTCAGTDVECDDANYCTIDFCDQVVGCTFEYDEESTCDDGNECTVDDRCSVGGCAGVLIHWRFEEQEWNGTPDEVVDSADMYHGTSFNEAYVIPNARVGQGARFDEGNGINVGRASTGYYVHENTRTVSMWVKYDDVNAGHQAIGAFSGAGKRFYLGIDGDNNIFAGYGSDYVGFSKPSVPSGIASGEWARMVLTYDGTTVYVYVNNVLKISFDATFHAGGQGPEYFLGTQEGNVEVDEVVVDERYWPPAQVARDYDNGDGPNPYDYTKNCDDENECTDDFCHREVGCVNTPNANGCDDANACTIGDVCSGGTCSGVELNCDDGDVCTDDSCDTELGCLSEYNTASCDDGDTCTTNDVCAGGTCSGIPLNCDDGNPCTDDSCVAGVGCVNTNNALACDDSNACTVDDVCSGGSCVGTDVSCDDGDLCTQDVCNPASGCTYTTLDPCPNCAVDADCDGLIPCTEQPEGCGIPFCNAGFCECTAVADGTSCSEYNEADYPSNCYDGFCDADGNCVPTQHPAYNNLCSDAFVDGDAATIDTSKSSYIGLFENTDPDGTKLSVTGTTLCAENNYEAGGDYCDECEDSDGDGVCDSISGNIGANGRDLVYVFEYETNSADQFELYSYVIKVEATFDIGLYIKSDVVDGNDCPEGFDQAADTSFNTVSSAICEYPYDLGGTPPPPTVVEDDCADDGNTNVGQDCCDPCTDDNCYKWCKRGYNMDGTSCDMCLGYESEPDYDPMTFTGNCDRLWTYPQDVFDCSASTPDEPGYDDYIYMASSVISPEGDTDGSKRTVFVFIDGVAAESGDFYLSVERRRWYASPCDRVEDDARVYDVTNVGSGGQTYIGSLEDVVNSMHDDDGDVSDDTCGGYDCDGLFTGKSDCHDSGSENQFWPNEESFKIHRPVGSGDQTYCIRADESIANAADIVLSAWYRTDGYYTICDAGYNKVNCGHDNAPGGDARLEFTAEEGTLYLIGVSEYSSRNRPCDDAVDSCHYKLSVTEGECGLDCVSPNETVAGPAIEINNTTYGVEMRSGTIEAASQNDYYLNGWDKEDDVYALYNNTGETVKVTFEVCGVYDSMIGLYNCEQILMAGHDWYWAGDCDSFSYELPPSSEPYYVTADTFVAPPLGDYTLTVSWGSLPVSCVDPTTFYSGAILGTFEINGSTFPSGNTISGDTSDGVSVNSYDPYANTKSDGPDDAWLLNVSADSTVRFSACPAAGGSGSFNGRIIIYDCAGNKVQESENGCGANPMPSTAADLKAANSPYYVIIDGDGSAAGNQGSYGFAMSYL